MVYIGLFMIGVCSSALAAMYTPKKKANWGNTAPRVKVKVHIGEGQ